MKKNKGPTARKKGLTINWQCVTQNCSYRATTVDGHVELSTGLHNHQQNVEKFLKRESRVRLKTALTATDDPVAEVSKSEDDILYLMAILCLGCSQYSGQS